MCARLEKEVPTMHIHISCDVPLARGLGSSSCCVVAGLAAANAWFGSPLSKEELFEEAVKLEGHPDNAAPAIFGGLCICIPQLFRFSVKGWHVAALIPNTQVSTNEARKLLPASLSLHEAALQAGRNALVVQGLLSGDLPMLQTASEDMLHEPYRSRLIPEYEAAKAFYQDKAVLWISGSGSTMLVLSKDEIEKFPGVETRFLSFDDEGVKVDDE
jgi:homoserine kinase